MTIDPEGDFMHRMVERTKEQAISPTYFRYKSQCTKEKEKGYHVFAKVQDRFGEYHYLSANNEDEIDKYCDGGVLGYDMAVCDYSYNISPFMASRHFKWVGKGHDPYRIARPIYEYNEKGEYVGLREFKEKW